MILQFVHRFFFVLPVIIVLGCGGQKTSMLEDEVLGLHDEVMPYLEDMKRQKRELMARKFDSASDSLAAQEIIGQLHLGDSLMWSWMHQYKPVDGLQDSLSEDEIQDYLIKQHKKMMRVRDVSFKAMDDANALLIK